MHSGTSSHTMAVNESPAQQVAERENLHFKML